MALSRFFILTLSFTSIFALTLFASPQEFKSCQLKYQVSSIYINNTQAFAINDEYVLFYSEKEPSAKIIKRDPFLGLNLMKADRKFKHSFKFYNTMPKQLASILPNKAVEGKFVQEQIGLNQLASFSPKPQRNSLISGPCCGLMGISTGTGIIEKEYIRNFLESKEIVYSDIGIRLTDDKGARVVEVNPFFADSPFLLDDVILYMDGKKAKSAATVSKKILFSKPQSLHHFIVLREGKEQKVKAIFTKRLSGGLVPDSFFDFFGVELNEFLVVKKNAAKYELKKGDKLLFVMGKDVKTLGDIRHVLSLAKSSKEKVITLLFRRKGFDFFIHFDKPSNSK